MPQTQNYKWEVSDLIGKGGFGYVFKVGIFPMTNSSIHYVCNNNNNKIISLL